MGTASALAIVGNLNLDLWVDGVVRFPRTDEEILATSSRLELAGTAGYVIQAALALGMEPRVVSTIGDDLLGRIVLRELDRLGCPDEGTIALPGMDTSLGIIFIAQDGSRSILTTLGAHTRMDVDAARSRDAFIAGAPDVLLCGAYLLPAFGPRALIPYAAELRMRGHTVAFDPSWDPAGFPESTRDATLALLPEIDVYLPNDAELLALTGADSLDAAIDMVAPLAGEVVVKRGPDGALFARGAERIAAPGFPVDVVNTIGAGDVFDTAYLHARRRGLPPAERLAFANATAALVVSQPPPRVYPDASAIEAALRRWNGNRTTP
jgi:ribokinase